jgi:hypothetical protein
MEVHPRLARGAVHMDIGRCDMIADARCVLQVESAGFVDSSWAWQVVGKSQVDKFAVMVG